jgi:hypothetical protein
MGDGVGDVALLRLKACSLIGGGIPIEMCDSFHLLKGLRLQGFCDSKEMGTVIHRENF